MYQLRANRRPVQLLRRFGRHQGKFYFESGRRCASGQGTITMAATETEGIMAALDEARKDLKSAESAKHHLFAEKAKQDKEAAEKAKAEELAAEQEQAAAMAKHKKAAEAQARSAREAEKRKAEEFAKAEAAAAAQAEAEKEDIYASQAEVHEQQKKLAEQRQAAAAKLVSSKKTETLTKVVPKKDRCVLFFGSVDHIVCSYSVAHITLHFFCVKVRRDVCRRSR